MWHVCAYTHTYTQSMVAGMRTAPYISPGIWTLGVLSWWCCLGRFRRCTLARELLGYALRVYRCALLAVWFVCFTSAADCHLFSCFCCHTCILIPYLQEELYPPGTGTGIKKACECLAWLLGIGLGSTARAGQALALVPWATSPAFFFFFLIQFEWLSARLKLTF